MDYIKQNIKTIGFIGCALMIIGNFLPFLVAKASLFGVSNSESASLLSGDIAVIGIIAIILEVVLALLIKTNKKKLTLIPVAIVLIFLFVCKDSFSGYNFGIGSVKYGAGFYVILIGCIICIAYAFINGSTKVTNPFETIKEVSNKGKSKSNEEAKFCPNCGNKVKKDAKFCNKCGEKC